MNRLSGALLLLLVLASLAHAQLRPPLHKAWEARVTEQLDSVVLDKGRLFYGTSKAYGALDQTTGKRLWEVVLPEKYFGASVALHQGTLFVAVGKQGLLACNPQTGKTLWSVPSTYYGTSPAPLGEYVFLTPREGFLTAIALKTHKPLWTLDLHRRGAHHDENSMFGPSVMVPRDATSLLVGTQEAEVLCLDAATGKTRWRRAFPLPKYRGEIKGITVGSRLYVTHDGNLEALDSRTGRVLWRFTREDDFSEALETPQGQVLVSTSEGVVYAVEARSGKLRWSRRLETASSWQVTMPRLWEGKLLLGAGSRLVALDLTGKQLWEEAVAEPGEHFFNAPLPLLPDTHGVLIGSYHAFLKFEPGAPTGAASESAQRRAQAQELMAHLDDLSFEQKRLLATLGDAGFEALLPLLTERVARSQRKGEPSNRLNKALEALRLVMQPRHTEAVLTLLKSTQGAQTPDARATCATLFYFLAAERSGWIPSIPDNRTDPALLVPLFLAECQKGPTSDGYSSALGYLTRSTHPDALAFLKPQLTNPSATKALRRAAYLNLARTGGVAFVPALLAARDTRRTVPPLATRLDLHTLAPTVLPEEKTRYAATRVLALAQDSQKRLWALLVSDVLGSNRDLWIARWDGTRWQDPLFTGTKLTVERIKDDEVERLPQDWQKRFLANPALRRDSDHDGLTDLVEARLGTHPHRADSDGDCLRDDQDKNPLAAPHPLTEQEKILAAAFEARYHEEAEDSGPCQVELPAGIRPLELAGRNDRIVCTADGKHSPLEKVVGEGATFVSFGLPQYDFQQARVLAPSSSKQWLLWNADHTQVRLSVNAYIGKRNATGYDIQLKKFGNNWIVVKAEMTWIS